MKLLVIILILWTSDVSGQNSIIGSWTSYSLDFDDNEKGEIIINDRYDKVHFTFNLDITYMKSYYAPEKTGGIPLYKHYEVKGKKLIKKQILTEDGYHLKMLIVKEKIEKGYFKINATQDTIILISDKRTYKQGFKYRAQNLIIADKLDHENLYTKLIVDEKKRKKRGGS